MIGKTFFHYKVLEELGEGGMGTVYIAEHTRLNKKYALKFLYPHLAKKTDIKERFIREAQAQASLRHPNIVQTIDYIEAEGEHILVSEYIEGSTLSDIINNKGGRLSAEEIIGIMEGPLEALNYVHSKGIVHRDLKPSNILVDNEGKGYITDFGIALILGMDRMTRTGTGMGTPHYMSPEQIKNPKNIDHRSDIYSIGCILYEMASGQPVFDGDTDYDIKDKHIKTEPKELGILRPDLPEHFISAIMKSLSKNPNDRFAGCNEMSKVLKEEYLTRHYINEQPHIPITTAPNSLNEDLTHPYATERSVLKTVKNYVETTPEQDMKHRHTSKSFAKWSPGWFITIIAVLIVLLLYLVTKQDENSSNERNYYSKSSSPSSNTTEFQSRQKAKQTHKAAEKEQKRFEETERNHPVKEDHQLAEAEQKHQEEESQYLGMARIPAGSFEMGDHFNEGDSDEKPIHTVYISEFWMDKYEVTNGEYKKCVDEGVCRDPENKESTSHSSYYGNSRYDNYPVIYVSWDDARKYCQLKGKRLPTEAEWEYAARGDLNGARYPWGDSIKGSDANYWDSGDSDDNDTTAVGSYAANGYGLYDMAGNVYEWILDWYEEDYYFQCSNPIYDPQGPIRSTSNRRCLRGGSWAHNPPELRISDRGAREPDTRQHNYGFRCTKN